MEEFTIVFETGNFESIKAVNQWDRFGSDTILIDGFEVVGGKKIKIKRDIGYVEKHKEKEYSIVYVGKVKEKIDCGTVVYIAAFEGSPGVALLIDDPNAEKIFYDDWNWIKGCVKHSEKEEKEGGLNSLETLRKELYGFKCRIKQCVDEEIKTLVDRIDKKS